MSCVWLANLGQAVNFKKLFVYLKNKLLKYQLVLLNKKVHIISKLVSELFAMTITDIRKRCFRQHLFPWML